MIQLSMQSVGWVVAGAGEKVVPRLGELLLARKLITEAQLAAAITRQQTEPRLLGELLMDAQAINARQLQRSLSWQRWLRQALQVASLSLVTLQTVAANDWNGEELNNSSSQIGPTQFDAWDALQVSDTSPRSAAAVSQDASTANEYRKSRRRFENYLKDAVGESAYIFLKGRYSGKADDVVEGLRYTVRWRKDSINVEFKYTF
ncbi:hypothetical protein HPT27_09040 [Permianibacter sp. IMCC34836]|uniref:hypothetical protein n=1 Tax=Permianibacter fluminis TaxID=2738515 RepID=UPI0015535C6F|nr:hypothetical protein [Permianibacter fluminis]NQD37170.1 hypothetical protein [Permianibacter fluminis]